MKRHEGGVVWVGYAAAFTHGIFVGKSQSPTTTTHSPQRHEARVLFSCPRDQDTSGEPGRASLEATRKVLLVKNIQRPLLPAPSLGIVSGKSSIRSVSPCARTQQPKSPFRMDDSWGVTLVFCTLHSTHDDFSSVEISPSILAADEIGLLI